MKTCRVIVASRNPVKMEAVRRGFQRWFPDARLTLEGAAVPSGVSDQPIGDEETRRGARQRASRAAQAFPHADFWVGIEGGVAWWGNDLLSFAWVAVQRKDGALGEARSGTFMLPPAVASLVRAGHELGEADDRVFGQHNSKQKMGAVGLLTAGLIDRTALYEHAIILALAPFGEAWQHALASSS